MKIHTYDTPQETAEAVTHCLIKELDTLRRDTFNLAISGGSTPEALFRIWAAQYRKKLPWHRIHLYWVDERCVAPTSSESNFANAKRLFLDTVDIPRTQIHRIMGEANPVHEAQRYSELVKKNLPSADGFPQFDVILAGIGRDGHTSSIFPGQNELLTTDAPYASSVNPLNGQHRIALTGQPMLRAGLTLFHVTGTDKADIVAQAVIPSSEAGQIPAGYIAQNGDRIEFFIDNAAAARLQE